MSNQITVSSKINAPANRVWETITEPSHITHWNFATPEWKCPKADNDLTEGGKFSYRMEAADGSEGFDFAGTYDTIIPNEKIVYHLDDSRKVEVTISEEEGETTVTQTFDPDKQAPLEMQQMGWQAILNNFKKYTEIYSATQ